MFCHLPIYVSQYITDVTWSTILGSVENADILLAGVLINHIETIDLCNV